MSNFPTFIGVERRDRRDYVAEVPFRSLSTGTLVMVSRKRAEPQPPAQEHMVTTHSYGVLRHGSAWFTTSPEQLAKPPAPPPPPPTIVVRRKADGSIERLKGN